jgi:hypothetical protein
LDMCIFSHVFTNDQLPLANDQFCLRWSS